MDTGVRRRAMTVAGLLVALATPGLPCPASGRSSGHGSLERAVERALHCEATRLTSGRDLDCATSLAGAQRDFVEDVVALAYGDLRNASLVPAGLHAPLRCQQAIARTAARLTGQALAGVANPRAAGADLRAACRAPVAVTGHGQSLPAVGPQCAAAIGPPGGRVDSDALHDCFAALLPIWADRLDGAEPLRPNIVLIVTDDQRWDTVDGTHLGDGSPAMPAVMDELAASGLSFQNGFVTNPVCGPSRASILTGQYAHHHRMLRNGGVQGGALHFDDRSTLATWLRDAGYRTGFYGKYLNNYSPLRLAHGGVYVPPGWDDWRAFETDAGNTFFDYQLVEGEVVVSYGSAEGDYSTDVLARHALRFVDAATASGAPFFLLWKPTVPHFPYVPAPRHAGLFLEPDSLAPLAAPSFFEADVSDKPAWVRALDPFSLLGSFIVQVVRIQQLQMLQSVDDFVAELMARLREHGVADDTLVAFTSDNGNTWGEHRWTGKACIYEECLRVPLLMRYPRLVPLAREEATRADNIDLAPTLAELAGLPPGPEMDGRSLVRVLDGTEREPAAPLHFESYSGSRRTFVGTRDERWKFAEHLTGERELYDLAADPFELENLASRPEQATRLQQLRQRALARRPGWPNDLD